MSSTALQPIHTVMTAPGAHGLPAIPWRDPHLVSPQQLAEYIGALEHACEKSPRNADLRTCLGIAHAMNYDAYKSMDALELARELDSSSFWAQFKYAELHYRLRILLIAEQETIRAIDLAGSIMELQTARNQLTAIRALKNNGVVRPTWAKSLVAPAVGLLLMTTVLCFAQYLVR